MSDAGGHERIGPTAHYTAYVWHRLRLPYARHFKTRTGRVLYWGFFALGEWTTRVLPELPSMKGYLAYRHRLIEAGVDMFHCSTRRFWEPEFEGSPLNLAGWTRKLSGKPTMTVGSIALDTDFITTYGDQQPTAQIDPARLDELMRRFNDGEFDMVAIGRALIANPDLPEILREGRIGDIRPYDRELLLELA